VLGFLTSAQPTRARYQAELGGELYIFGRFIPRRWMAADALSALRATRSEHPPREEFSQRNQAIEIFPLQCLVR
jgi:hypothetical protein